MSRLAREDTVGTSTLVNCIQPKYHLDNLKIAHSAKRLWHIPDTRCQCEEQMMSM